MAENGRLNRRATVIGYLAAGTTILGGFLTVIVMLVGYQIAPLREQMMANKDRLEVAERIGSKLEFDLRRISDLAAERGIAIPQLRSDILKLETELGRMRERIERIERPKN